jgi:hypothetical protein
VLTNAGGVALANHGGLTPPALTLQCECLSAKNDFCDARTQVHKSGGRQPAVGLVTQLQLRTLSSSDRRQPAVGVVMQLQRCSRTDGFRVASARQLRCCRCKRVLGTTAGLRQPLLVARRSLQKSGCDLQHRAKQQQQQPPQAHFVADMRLRFATVFCFPRGAYAPRSCCRANVCRRKNDFGDARTHIHKSGGRQPAVGVREARLQERFRKVAGDCRRRAHERRWSRSSEPRGAYAPRSWCSANVCRRKNDLCDARTHIRRSAGPQPAVGMSNAVAIADAFVQRPASAACRSETTVATATRWISAFRDRIPSTSHGGLTPPALTLQSERLSAKKTIFAMHERRFTRAAGVSPPWA